jgi:hypothetical protein
MKAHRQIKCRAVTARRRELKVARGEVNLHQHDLQRVYASAIGHALRFGEICGGNGVRMFSVLIQVEQEIQ